ncbi:O-antigen ligase family protein [Trichococcus shcherbakoviae]|uniref:O-antigen ligase family protein n=1 Tax=Trichococcus shcherbakoviae TaxID=2094020 RepID=UPI002AA665FA|nr:O-antigen ligase family protein [Trichococcus shcherbakoviae]
MRKSLNRGDLIHSNIEKPNKKTTFLLKSTIFIFPFATFIGPYLNVSGINLSNLFSLLLALLVFKQFLKGRFNNTKVYILFFIFMIVYSLFTIIWSKYSAKGLSIFFPLVTGVIAMAFVASLDNENLKYFIDSISIFTYLILIVAMYETFFGNYVFFDNINFIYVLNTYGFHYPGVAFANPNDLAQYLVCAVPIILVKQFDDKKIFLPIFIAFFVFFILLNTNSRFSIISFFIIMLSYFTFFLSKNKVLLKRVFFAGAFSLILVNFLPILGFDLKQFGILKNFLLIDSSMEYYTGRNILYANAFNLGSENLLFGSGLGGSYTVTSVGTHNMFLFIFSDLGILFAFGFGLLLVLLFLKLYSYRKLKLLDCHLSSLMLSFLVAFPIVSSMSSANEQRKIIWLILGLMLSVLSNYKEKTKQLI